MTQRTVFSALFGLLSGLALPVGLRSGGLNLRPTISFHGKLNPSCSNAMAAISQPARWLPTDDLHRAAIGGESGSDAVVPGHPGK